MKEVKKSKKKKKKKNGNEKETKDKKKESKKKMKRSENDDDSSCPPFSGTEREKMTQEEEPFMPQENQQHPHESSTDEERKRVETDDVMAQEKQQDRHELSHQEQPQTVQRDDVIPEENQQNPHELSAEEEHKRVEEKHQDQYQLRVEEEQPNIEVREDVTPLQKQQGPYEFTLEEINERHTDLMREYSQRKEKNKYQDDYDEINEQTEVEEEAHAQQTSTNFNPIRALISEMNEDNKDKYCDDYEDQIDYSSLNKYPAQAHGSQSEQPMSLQQLESLRVEDSDDSSDDRVPFETLSQFSAGSSTVRNFPMDATKRFSTNPVYNQNIERLTKKLLMK